MQEIIRSLEQLSKQAFTNSSAANVVLANVHTNLKLEDTAEKPNAVLSKLVSHIILGSLLEASFMRKSIKRKRKAVSTPMPDHVDHQEFKLPHPKKIYIPERGRVKSFLIGDSCLGVESVSLSLNLYEMSIIIFWFLNSTYLFFSLFNSILFSHIL